MPDFMTSFKPAWHLDKIQALRNGQDIVPTQIQLIISDLCNQDCGFCAYRMSGGFSTELFPDEQGNKNPNRMMPTKKAIEILTDYADMGGKAVQFTGGGEPTVHPEFLYILQVAQDLGLQTGVVTNGIRLTDHWVYQNLDWLRISLDAGTEETYKELRKSNAWPKAMHALHLAGTFTKPKVGVGFVVTRENYSEIGKALEITKGAGIEYMRLSAMFSEEGSGYYKSIPDLSDHIPDDLALVNFFHERIEDLDDGAPDYDFCGMQQFVLYIGADQNVYTCCTNAYTTHGKIGELKEQRFQDWIVSHGRREFNARSCHHCQFNSKNRLIQYLLDPAPEHVDFV